VAYDAEIVKFAWCKPGQAIAFALVYIAVVMLVSLLAVSYFVCVHADLKTGSATTVANFLRSSEFLDAATDALAGIMKDTPTAADRGLLRATVEKDFDVAGLGGAAIMSKGQKDAWLTLLKNLKHLSLKSVGNRRLGSLNATEANVTYKFHSFDSNQNEGTGTLGSNGMKDHSVSEVTVVPNPPGFSFTIGPPVAGMYLIGGTLDVVGRDEHQIKGKIRAAFVNLRTTLTGTWESESNDMDSVLRIHLKELGVNEEWVWKPDGKPEKLDKTSGSTDGSDGK